MKFLIILSVIAIISSSCCASSSSSSSESSSSSSSSSKSSSHESSHSRKVKCPYTLWIGDDVDREYSIDLKCRSGTPFIDAMSQAASKNKRFKFYDTIHPRYGRFIDEICGVPNNNQTGQFWILYDLPSKPDIYNKPKFQSPVGVSELKVTKHHYYLFWYQTSEGRGQCD